MGSSSSRAGLLQDTKVVFKRTAFFEKQTSKASACGWHPKIDMLAVGQKLTNQGVSAWQFGLIDSEVEACNVSEAANSERCAYPDVFTAAFNASLTYNCPTIITYPHFYKVGSIIGRHMHFPFLSIMVTRRAPKTGASLNLHSSVTG